MKKELYGKFDINIAKSILRNGISMLPEGKNRIFFPFQQVPKLGVVGQKQVYNICSLNKAFRFGQSTLMVNTIRGMRQFFYILTLKQVKWKVLFFLLSLLEF